MDFRQIISDRMRELGMTQRRLQALTGVHQVRISDYLTGKRDVYADTLQKMLAALGLKIVRAKRPAARRQATASLRATQRHQTRRRSGKRKGT